VRVLSHYGTWRYIHIFSAHFLQGNQVFFTVEYIRNAYQAECHVRGGGVLEAENVEEGMMLVWCRDVDTSVSPQKQCYEENRSSEVRIC